MFRITTLPIVAMFTLTALAQVPVEQLAKPPADEQVWTITSSEGAARHGQVSLWTTKDGPDWSRFKMDLPGSALEAILLIPFKSKNAQAAVATRPRRGLPP